MTLLEVTNFTDLFKKSVLERFGQSMEPVQFVITLAAALLLGLGIFWIYKRCFTGVVYDHSFNVSLVVMTILVAVIIVTISSNITLSLGMVGALSIVRYRTAVKSPMDLMFLFWAITSGIAVGANYYAIALIGFFFVAATFLILRGAGGDATTYMLIVNLESKAAAEEQIVTCLKPYHGKVRSKIVRNGQTELSFEVRIRNNSLKITDEVTAIEGVKDVTLVQYRGSYAE